KHQAGESGRSATYHDEEIAPLVESHCHLMILERQWSEGVGGGWGMREQIVALFETWPARSLVFRSSMGVW
ncbi:MAG: hypothetical protein WAK29_18025, partial [Terriglobales bacterium]